MENKKYFLIFLIGGILLFLAVVVTLILVILERKADWSDYDSYILSIYWGPSLCFNKKENENECFNKLDEVNINKSFIIHGLWPTYTTDEDTGDCNSDNQIDVSFNGEIEKNLSVIWPGLYSSDHETWKHEYNKHGYCYIKRMGNDVEKDYAKYFEKTVYMFGNLKNIFEVILPDTPQGLHTITKSKLKEFIETSALEIKPSTYSLQCVENKNSNTFILNEIWFNYDFEFNPTTNIQKTDSCPDRFDIYFRDEYRQAVWDKYDFYVLSTIWGPTYCRGLGKEGKECYKRLKNMTLNTLTILGLWPSYTTGIIPQWCNLDTNIEINNFTEDMEKYWINIYNKDNKEFWEHEYNKHGFCYNKKLNLSTDNYLNYFNKTIELYHKLNLTYLLYEFYPDILGGINKLNQSYLQGKLEDKFGNNTFAIVCQNINGVYFLNEIRIKLNLDFVVDKNGKTTNNCSGEFYVEFLENEGPKNQSIDFYKEYDMYFFTILWLGTTCHQKGWRCYDRIKDEAKNKFTVHGLWPNLKNGTLPEWCNGPNDIEIEIQNSTLLDFMSTYWVTGYHTEKYFWGHEYNKHGYCYNQREKYDVKNYEIYFQKCKDMFIENKFENLFSDYFNKEGIEIEVGDMAINRTKFEKFWEEKGMNKYNYLIVCTNITYNETVNYPHILEIRIRYSMDFNLLYNNTDKSEFDCPEIFYAQFL